jgi:hypothetical protein
MRGIYPTYPSQAFRVLFVGFTFCLSRPMSVVMSGNPKLAPARPFFVFVICLSVSAEELTSPLDRAHVDHQVPIALLGEGEGGF